MDSVRMGSTASFSIDIGFLFSRAGWVGQASARNLLGGARCNRHVRPIVVCVVVLVALATSAASARTPTPSMPPAPPATGVPAFVGTQRIALVDPLTLTDTGPAVELDETGGAQAPSPAGRRCRPVAGSRRRGCRDRRPAGGRGDRPAPRDGGAPRRLRAQRRREP